MALVAAAVAGEASPQSTGCLLMKGLIDGRKRIFHVCVK
jgi:hypothetical protein